MKTDQLSTILSQELAPGETVLWEGQPVPEKILFKHLKYHWLSLGLFVFLTCATYHSSGNPIGPLSIIGFVALMASLVKPLRMYINCRNWLYVITNQRIIIIEVKRDTIISSYSRAEIATSNILKKYGPKGIGSIIFRRGGTFGFVCIPDAQAVAALVDKTFRQPQPQPPRQEPPIVQWPAATKIQ